MVEVNVVNSGARLELVILLMYLSSMTLASQEGAPGHWSIAKYGLSSSKYRLSEYVHPFQVLQVYLVYRSDCRLVHISMSLWSGDDLGN